MCYIKDDKYTNHQLEICCKYISINSQDDFRLKKEKTYGNMNVEFWEKHQNTSLEDAKAMVEKSHNEVLCLAETFSNEELFSKGVYQWVGGSALGSYFVSVTSSHYDWAMKKIKAHVKNCKKQ